MLVSSNRIPIYQGKAIFQPFDIIENGGWLASPGGRAAAFFCSAAWAIGNMTTVSFDTPVFLLLLCLLALSLSLPYPLFLALSLCLSAQFQSC